MSTSIRVATFVIAILLTVGWALASPDAKKHEAKNPICTICRMELSPTKDQIHVKRVRLSNKIYYCCSGCNTSQCKKDKNGIPILPLPQKH
jgi:hypothetical protein